MFTVSDAVAHVHQQRETFSHMLPVCPGAAVQVQLHRWSSLWEVPVQSLVPPQEIPGQLTSCWPIRVYLSSLVCLVRTRLISELTRRVRVFRSCLAAELTRGRACRGRCPCLCLRRWTDSSEFPSSVSLRRSTATSNSSAPPSPTSTASLDPEGETGVTLSLPVRLRYTQLDQVIDMSLNVPITIECSTATLLIFTVNTVDMKSSQTFKT